MGCCIGDGGLPKEYSTLSSLQELFLGSSSISRLPKHFHLLSKLQTLDLQHCTNLREISHLPPSLTVLDISDCHALARLSSLSSLKNMRKLVLCNCRGLGELMGLECLSHLQELNISGCKGLINLPHSASLTSLRLLYLAGSGVSLLQDNAPWIQKLVSLELVTLHGDKVPECFSSCKREIQLGVISEQNAEHCCMEVRVPEGDMACKGVVCCIASLGDELGVYTRRNRAGYMHAQAKVLGAEGDSPKFTQLLFDSTHADSRYQLHVSIFRAAHPFAASLKGGDTIRVNVAFPLHCIQTVTEGAVKLIYEENEMEEILQELSMQTISNEIEEGDLELINWSVDGGLPDAYSTLSSLQKMDLKYMQISQLPNNFHLLTNLKSLDLSDCYKLSGIPSLPPTLVDLDLGYSYSLRAILCLSSLKELRNLVLCDCIKLEKLVGLDCLVHLSQLNISGCSRLKSLPSGLEKLTSLKFLYMAGSGVSLLQDNEPWIQKLASLELISVYGDETPECLLKVKVKGVMENKHANECCMEVTVPEVDAAYKAVLCCFVSHDQRWNGTGRYHTGVHVEIIEREADSPKFSQVLFVNRLGDERNQLHISIFRASHPFVASLQGGNRIRVLAISPRSGASTVSEGGGKLMSGENEMDETLRTLSRQSKLKRQKDDRRHEVVYHF